MKSRIATACITAFVIVAAACSAPTPTPQLFSPFVKGFLSSLVEGSTQILEFGGEPLADNQRECLWTGFSAAPVFHSPRADDDIRWLADQPRAVQNQSPINLAFADVSKECLTAIQFSILTGHSVGRAIEEGGSRESQVVKP